MSDCCSLVSEWAREFICYWKTRLPYSLPSHIMIHILIFMILGVLRYLIRSHVTVCLEVIPWRKFWVDNRKLLQLCYKSRQDAKITRWQDKHNGDSAMPRHVSDTNRFTARSGANHHSLCIKDHRQRIPRFVIRWYLQKSIQKKLFCHLQSLQIDYFPRKKRL